MDVEVGYQLELANQKMRGPSRTKRCSKGLDGRQREIIDVSLVVDVFIIFDSTVQNDARVNEAF
ncbi:hypothetical protein ACEQ8H_003459 [Pleosporales sp. CAS-2024a]